MQQSMLTQQMTSMASVPGFNGSSLQQQLFSQCAMLSQQQQMLIQQQAPPQRATTTICAAAARHLHMAWLLSVGRRTTSLR